VNPAPSAAPPFVLASGSPRRTALLRMLGIAHEVDPADVDEALLPAESPATHVERLAREKAALVARRHPDALVLAGDTVVVRDGTVLGDSDVGAERLPRVENHAQRPEIRASVEAGAVTQGLRKKLLPTLKSRREPSGMFAEGCENALRFAIAIPASPPLATG